MSTEEYSKEEFARMKAQVESMEDKTFCPCCWTILWKGFEDLNFAFFSEVKIFQNSEKEFLDRNGYTLQKVSVQSAGEDLPRLGFELVGSDHQLPEQLLQEEGRW